MPQQNHKKQKKTRICLDRVNPSDYLKYDLIYACEQCSHYAPSTQSCTFGYNTEFHRQAQQDATYNLCGHMAFCRLIEID